ncbi:uncharacterized protein zmp:0000000881 [Nerophis ophidion]|uniref:uncharacterized protein zmp:0000000881 n=1 Tax=Nerophis ophidion TaxID=159077 RepID=UPI002ADF05B9|nr:uncharacterized protein zmp:0000000881 [Nerophis ophidion]
MSNIRHIVFRPQAGTSCTMAFSTQTVAAGCFGKVYKQKYNDTWAAIKKVPQPLITKKDLEREYEVYKKANHPNIVQLMGKIKAIDGFWIIPLEFIFGEDLETTIFKTAKSKIKLTPATKGKIIVGMCEGLLHLHALDIVHQDLKPDNIMVEHDTHRAVIIDLGLAKFFRCGLNSAKDRGNEAYSAPEVLQGRGQRDQRSDVWAMGKIIAELCARIRLHTPSVGPEKIREVIPEQPYCQAVCRMVETNPVKRASVVGVITDIRAAVSANRLRPPSTHVHPRDRSPSPLNRERGRSSFNEPQNRPPSPFQRSPSPVHMDLPQQGWERSLRPPSTHVHPRDRSPSPLNRERGSSSFNEPQYRPPSPFQRSPSPVHMDLPRPGWERSSRSQLRVDCPRSGTPSPKKQEIRDNGRQDLVSTAVQDLNEGMLKMALYKEASRDLSYKLPPTGHVMVRHYEENGGVVTRNGKIIKYNDITYKNQ